MDWKKIVLSLVILVLLLFSGYSAYRFWLSERKLVTTNEQEIIELLQKNQGAIIKLQTDIADVEKRVVTDTLKETIVIRDEGQTYEGLKDTLLILREDEEANKAEIERLRVEYEKRIAEYRESLDKIMVKSDEGSVIIYEDSEGNLVSLSEGVEIIRHRKTEPLLEKKPDLMVGQTIEEVNDKFRLSILYDGNFTPAISYSVFDWRDLSLNVTGYDFQSPKLGADISYNIRGNLEIGAGIGLVDIMEMDLIRNYYVRFGIRLEF